MLGTQGPLLAGLLSLWRVGVAWIAKKTPHKWKEINALGSVVSPQ